MTTTTTKKQTENKNLRPLLLLKQKIRDRKKKASSKRKLPKCEGPRDSFGNARSCLANLCLNKISFSLTSFVKIRRGRQDDVLVLKPNLPADFLKSPMWRKVRSAN